MLKVIGINAMPSRSNTQPFGHAWLSLYFDNGRKSTVGLWPSPSDLITVKRGVPLTFFQAALLGEVANKVTWGLINEKTIGEITYDIRYDEEIKQNYQPMWTRFYGLNEQQKTHAIACITQMASWRAEYTCASWALEKIAQIFGDNFYYSELFGVNIFPVLLGRRIQHLETRDPTSVDKPKYT